MKTGKYSLLVAAFAAVLFSGCNDTIFDDTNSMINYLSFQNSGCARETGLAKTNDEAQLTLSYGAGNLKVGVNFTTQCAAKFKDSVSVAGKKIDIYLADIATAGAKCICPYHEEFIFKIAATGEFKINFNYKPYAKTEYYLLADTTFIIK